MLNAAENDSAFSALVEEKAYSKRITDAKIELQEITQILELIAGDGTTPQGSAIKWLAPKLDNIADVMDRIDLDMLVEQRNSAQGGAA